VSNLFRIADTNLQAQVNTLTNVANLSTANVACVGTRATVTNDPANDVLYLVDGTGRVILQIGADLGIRMGHSAGTAAYGVSLGVYATATTYAVAIGNGARAAGSTGIGIGTGAESWDGSSIQLGHGSYGVAGTLQVFGFPLLEAAGTIPNARLAGTDFVLTNLFDNVTNVLYYSNGVVTNKVSL
jgi:hypothetical protein